MLFRSGIPRPFFQPHRFWSIPPACSPRLRPRRRGPAPDKVGRRPGCEARRHAPYLGGDCPPVPLRAGLLEASPTWPGTVSKFPAASPWERRRGSSPAAANLGPAPVLLDGRGTQAGFFFFFFFYAKAQAPPQRPCSYQELSANDQARGNRCAHGLGRTSHPEMLAERWLKAPLPRAPSVAVTTAASTKTFWARKFS